MQVGDLSNDPLDALTNALTSILQFLHMARWHPDSTKLYLSRSDRYYLKKTTKYVDKIWTYFAAIEEDFRLLHMPMVTK